MKRKRLGSGSTKYRPVSVVDIGSNSVRLVVYDGLRRAPTPVFNEKILCGLGREVQSTGLLAADAIERALAALRRFRALCQVMHVGRIFVVATAACRDRRSLRARYQLVAASSGEVLVDATAGSDAGIDVVNSEYATIAAENTALENLSQIVADQLGRKTATVGK